MASPGCRAWGSTPALWQGRGAEIRVGAEPQLLFPRAARLQYLKPHNLNSPIFFSVKSCCCSPYTHSHSLTHTHMHTRMHTRTAELSTLRLFQEAPP